MTPLAIDDRDTTDLDEIDDETSPLPGRPRMRLFTRVTVPLLALLLAAAGFLVGIEVEKGHGSTASGGSASATARGGLTSRSGFPGAAGSSSRGSSRPGASGPSGGFGGAGGSAGGGTAGTISSVSGDTIYLKTTSGNTIKVALTSATSLKKEQSVTRNAIRPGDTITVTGISGSGGSITAASVSDSGHASTSSTSSSS